MNESWPHPGLFLQLQLQQASTDVKLLVEILGLVFQRFQVVSRACTSETMFGHSAARWGLGVWAWVGPESEGAGPGARGVLIISGPQNLGGGATTTP